MKKITLFAIMVICLTSLFFGSAFAGTYSPDLKCRYSVKYEIIPVKGATKEANLRIRIYVENVLDRDLSNNENIIGTDMLYTAFFTETSRIDDYSSFSKMRKVRNNVSIVRAPANGKGVLAEVMIPIKERSNISFNPYTAKAADIETFPLCFGREYSLHLTVHRNVGANVFYPYDATPAQWIFDLSEVIRIPASVYLNQNYILVRDEEGVWKLAY